MAGETYNPIADSEIDPESAGTSPLFYKLRDNPLAMFGGAAGAPKIAPSAFNNISFNYFYLGTEANGAKIVSTNENISVGEYHHTNFTINAGQTLTLNSGSFLILRCTGTFTMNTGAIIDLVGKGGAGAIGGTSGFGTDGIKGGSGFGGGSGGAGGGEWASIYKGGDGGDSILRTASVAGGTGVNGGIGNVGAPPSILLKNIMEAYAANEEYNLIGAGGGSGSESSFSPGFGGNGGNGGGGLIVIADTIDFQTGASINANGADAPDHLGGGGTNGGGGGGGGGGTVILISSNMTNNGTINVAGGAGGDVSAGDDGGAGGAGFTKVITIG